MSLIKHSVKDCYNVIRDTTNVILTRLQQAVQLDVSVLLFVSLLVLFFVMACVTLSLLVLLFVLLFVLSLVCVTTCVTLFVNTCVIKLLVMLTVVAYIIIPSVHSNRGERNYSTSIILPNTLHKVMNMMM